MNKLTAQARILYYYPIILSAIGVCIHFFGALGWFQLEVPRTIHAVMLIIDSLVVIGLIKRASWGYWLAVFLYLEQSIMQPYWAYEAYQQGNGLFQLLVTSPLVIGALLALLVNKKSFTNQGRQS